MAHLKLTLWGTQLIGKKLDLDGRSEIPKAWRDTYCEKQIAHAFVRDAFGICLGATRRSNYHTQAQDT